MTSDAEVAGSNPGKCDLKKRKKNSLVVKCVIGSGGGGVVQCMGGCGIEENRGWYSV